MNLWELLACTAGCGPNAPAVRDGDISWSYAELEARAAGIARGLARRGVLRGDRVGMLAGNTADMLAAYFAVAGLGAIAVPLNTRLAPPELAAVVADCEPRIVLTGPTYGEVSEAGAPFVPVDAARDDIAQIYYTSGTTGTPKGVMLTHGNVATHAEWACDAVGLAATDRWGHFAPMFHLADAWAVFAVTRAGGCHVMLDRFEAEACLATIERERVTLTNLVPTMLRMIVDLPGGRDLSTLRLMLSGGAPIARELVARVVDRFGCEYVQTYGMTETSPFLTMSLLPEHLRVLGPDEQLAYRSKTGRPFGRVELRVVGEAGDDVVPDERHVGEILARGPTVTPGYWRRPEATREAFDAGWLRTGDLAVVDPEGFLTIVDRKKDVILTGGETVYSTEVENVLHAHAAVREAAVVGKPDEVWGELVCAFVVRRDEVDAASINAHCSVHLARYKRPRVVRFLDALPHTGSGKVDKRALRDRMR